MISIYSWDRAARCVHAIAVADLVPALRDDGSRVIWIDLAEPTPEDEGTVFGFLPVHTLTLEDATRLRREPDAAPHLPKVEEFPDYLFVVVNPLRQAYLERIGGGSSAGKAAAGASPKGGSPEAAHPFTQLSAVLTKNVLITHHQERVRCIDQLQGFLARHPAQSDRGPDYLFHLVLDAMVDEYAPALDRIDEDLDDLEERVIAAEDNHLFQTILRAKREIILLRKTLVYEREVIARLARGEFELVDERETVYYRNVYDHLVRFTELIESSREMATDLLQSHLASTSNRLSQIMKVLTTISTIILPMTLVTGIYGMNFEHMPETKWAHGYFVALGVMLCMGLGTVTFFWWKKWL